MPTATASSASRRSGVRVPLKTGSSLYWPPPTASSQVQAKLLASVDHAGKGLESWLREKFFTQHCKLFQNRPFIWHVWEGLRDGFSALLNYHRLDYKNLETLIYTYLGDWIKRQKQDISSGVDGAQERLAALVRHLWRRADQRSPPDPGREAGGAWCVMRENGGCRGGARSCLGDRERS